MGRTEALFRGRATKNPLASLFLTLLLLASYPTAEAQAQLKIMQEFPEPFFWAAYGLTGEP